MSRTPLFSLGLLVAFSVAGCGNSTPSDDGGTPAGNCVDFSQLPSTPTISFKDDLMPIFGLSCIASSCHDPSAKKAGLQLGDPAACGPVGTTCYDANAKWNYTFKQPLDPALLQTVLSNLVNVASKTNPAVMRIVPHDPSSSFLLDKVTGQEKTKQYPGTCTNQDPATSQTQSPCGSDMPLNSPNLCADNPAKVQAIAQWVQQGAQNN